MKSAARRFAVSSPGPDRVGGAPLSSGRSGSGRSGLDRWRCLGLGLAWLVVVAGTAACDRNIEPYRPGEEPSEPDLARIFPSGAGGPSSEGAEAAAQAGNRSSAAAARGAVPPSRAEAGGPAAPVAGGSAAAIAGTIEIADGLAGSAPASGILFVIARPEGVRAGPPLAVLRIPSPRFPVRFEIGPENVMIPTMRFEGSISLSARLDADGNAMTRGDSDLSSAVIEPLSPGANDVELILSQRG